MIWVLGNPPNCHDNIKSQYTCISIKQRNMLLSGPSCTPKRSPWMTPSLFFHMGVHLRCVIFDLRVHSERIHKESQIRNKPLAFSGARSDEQIRINVNASLRNPTLESLALVPVPGPAPWSLGPGPGPGTRSLYCTCTCNCTYTVPMPVLGLAPERLVLAKIRTSAIQTLKIGKG